LAIITQKQQNIFYSGNIVEEEEEKQETKMNSRRYSIDIMNFDYDTGSSSDSYQMQSSSFPPKDQKDILRSKKFLNVPNYFFFHYVDVFSSGQIRKLHQEKFQRKYLF